MPGADASILEIFKFKLRKEWRQRPACYLHDWACACERPFICTVSLHQWMKDTEKGESKTNVERLLEKVKVIRAGFPESILDGKYRCVLVFSILLEQNRGDLIYIFQNAEIIDKYLDKPKYNLSELQYQLEKYRIPDVDGIIKEFEYDKWDYCPARLELHMRRRFEDLLRLPFCARMKVNDKGGTACVYQVAVQQEFVSDEIKNHLGKSFDFRKYGQVSTMDLIRFINHVI